MAPSITPTGIERGFADDEIIVSKTDPTGRLTYVNDVFLEVSRYAEHDLLGQQHNIIRHPDMPHGVFKLLWDTIQDGREIFAYVVNLASDGAHYWVLAHVTPTFDPQGKIVGYHSNRRTASLSARAVIEPLYAQLREIESQQRRKAEAVIAGARALEDLLVERGISYDEFVWSLEPEEVAA